MASSSSLRSKNIWNHDVFLSFRGLDTRSTFSGHLHQALYCKGINVFIDTRLQRGEVITAQLFEVIQESRISIPVLSEKYASSSFCLDELAEILECRESKEQIVIPVFYHVHPTDVEEQRESFGREFAELEAQFNMTNLINDEEAAERVRKWRLGLTEVCKLSGYHLRKGNDEATVIRSIVQTVLKALNRTALHVANHPIGLASRADYILEKLTLGSNEVCILGLHGMGGIGKTTTAKALYNRCVSQFKFEGSSFLLNVRENSKKYGIAQLQESVIYDILGDRIQLSGNFERGIELIKARLSGKKVLIVIDDVDHIEQLQKLVGGLEWFGPGSRIIITTRDVRLLELHGVTMRYAIHELDYDEAMELFNWHAFKELGPSELYMELSRQVIRHAQGLPLALEVLGSSLYKRSVTQWNDALKKLERCPNNEITDVLKVSYDSLDSEEKAIFLDIVIFFRGEKKDEVVKFLDACGFNAHIGIQRLVEKSLVRLEFMLILETHDLLVAMGTQIALEESSRLLIREDIHMFLEIKRPHDVEGLLLDLHGKEKVSLKTLENFTKLRILIIRNGNFTEQPKKLPNSVRWLEWHNCSSESIPPGFLPGELVVLKMPSSIVPSWSSILDKKKGNIFINLTCLVLSHSKHLREIVDFSAMLNLEELDLTRCEKLKKIGKSIECLKKLEKLVLYRCSSLARVPNLAENPRLKSIDLQFCSKLKYLPNIPTTSGSLYARNSGIKEIPSFINNVKYFHIFDASNCRNLIRVSKLIEGGPGCTLHLSKNKFVSLPKDTFKFSKIEWLYLDNCQQLVEIPKLPSTLRMLKAENCKSLERFAQSQFESFEGCFINCHKLAKTEMQNWLVMLQNISHAGMEFSVPSTTEFSVPSTFSFWCMSQFRRILEWYKRCRLVYKDNLQRSFHIILPGNEIPEWFSYAIKWEGNASFVKLPLPVISDKFLGVVWCVVFQLGPQFCRQDTSIQSIEFSIDEFGLRRLIYIDDQLESEHMCIGFKSIGVGYSGLLRAEEITCEITSDPKDALICKKFGVHFIYRI